MRRLLVLLTLCAIVWPVACAGGDDGAPTATSSPTPTPTGTPSITPTDSAESTAAPEATEALSVTEGWPPQLDLAPIDDAIVALKAGDWDGFLTQVRTGALPCTPAVGLGGPPKCPDGVSGGTIVQFFPYFACDGWGTEEALRERLIDSTTRPLAVIEYQQPLFPAAAPGTATTHALVVMFNGYGSPDDGIRLIDVISFDDQGIVEIGSGCGAYSAAAIAAGELPDELSPGTVIWRVYPPV